MKIYNVIKRANEIYNSFNYGLIGMCFALKKAVIEDMPIKEINNKGMPKYKDLVSNIPEFTPEYLNSFYKNIIPDVNLWWPIIDTDSRIKAFNLLLSLYKNSDKEFTY